MGGIIWSDQWFSERTSRMSYFPPMDVSRVFKVMANFVLMHEWKNRKKLLPQFDPQELNPDFGFFLESIFLQLSDWSKNNNFIHQNNACQINQNFSLINNIYFINYFVFGKKILKLGWKSEKNQNYRFFAHRKKYNIGYIGFYDFIL